MEQQYPWPNPDEIIPGSKGIRRRGDFWDDIVIDGFKKLGIADEHGNRLIDDKRGSTDKTS